MEPPSAGSSIRICDEPIPAPPAPTCPSSGRLVLGIRGSGSPQGDFVRLAQLNRWTAFRSPLGARVHGWDDVSSLGRQSPLPAVTHKIPASAVRRYYSCTAFEVQLVLENPPEGVDSGCFGFGVVVERSQVEAAIVPANDPKFLNQLDADAGKIRQADYAKLDKAKSFLLWNQSASDPLSKSDNRGEASSLLRSSVLPAPHFLSLGERCQPLAGIRVGERFPVPETRAEFRAENERGATWVATMGLGIDLFFYADAEGRPLIPSFDLPVTEEWTRPPPGVWKSFPVFWYNLAFQGEFRLRAFFVSAQGASCQTEPFLVRVGPPLPWSTVNPRSVFEADMFGKPSLPLLGEQGKAPAGTLTTTKATYGGYQYLAPSPDKRYVTSERSALVSCVYDLAEAAYSWARYECPPPDPDTPIKELYEEFHRWRKDPVNTEQWAKRQREVIDDLEAVVVDLGATCVENAAVRDSATNAVEEGKQALLLHSDPPRLSAVREEHRRAGEAFDLERYVGERVALWRYFDAVAEPERKHLDQHLDAVAERLLDQLDELSRLAADQLANNEDALNEMCRASALGRWGRLVARVARAVADLSAALEDSRRARSQLNEAGVGFLEALPGAWPSPVPPPPYVDGDYNVYVRDVLQGALSLLSWASRIPEELHANPQLKEFLPLEADLRELEERTKNLEPRVKDVVAAVRAQERSDVKWSTLFSIATTIAVWAAIASVIVGVASIAKALTRIGSKAVFRKLPAKLQRRIERLIENQKRRIGPGTSERSRGSRARRSPALEGEKDLGAGSGEMSRSTLSASEIPGRVQSFDPTDPLDRQLLNSLRNTPTEGGFLDVTLFPLWSLTLRSDRILL